MTGPVIVRTMTACRSDRQHSPASPVKSLVHYIIVRADLPHGVQVAQTAHAAGESVTREQAPLPEGTIVVALSVPDEGSLLRIAHALGEHSQTYKLVLESDGAYAGQAMAIGVTPTCDRAAVRKAVSSLPLVK